MFGPRAKEMKTMTKTLAMFATALLCVAFAVPSSAESVVKSRREVQQSLGTLSRVVDHTQRLISEKNYRRLRGENDEFKEGAAALRETLAKESALLRAKVEPLLKEAAEESQNLANQAELHDANKLSQAHSAFADSITGILGAFPADVQPGRPSMAREKEEEAIRENEARSSDANVANQNQQGTSATTGSAR
jgi:hypothetical protein